MSFAIQCSYIVVWSLLIWAGCSLATAKYIFRDETEVITMFRFMGTARSWKEWKDLKWKLILFGPATLPWLMWLRRR